MIKTIFILFLSMLGTILFCALFLFIFANGVHMVCERQPNGTLTCNIEKKLFDRVTTFKQTVNGVTGAHVAKNCDSDGCSYRTELSTMNGESVPVNDVYTDYDPDKAARINNFMQGNDSSFTLDDPMQLWVVLLVGGMGLVGLGIETMMVFGEAYKWFVNRRTV
jgi:hypothetical protein